jgi:hypothetical protein
MTGGIQGQRAVGSPPCAEGAKAELPVEGAGIPAGDSAASVEHAVRRVPAGVPSSELRRSAHGALRAPLKT